MSRVLRKRTITVNSDEDKDGAVKVKNEAAKKKREAKAQFKTEDDAEKVTGKNSIKVMLAQSYDPDRDDPSGWLMSEKMDGVRCYWNGSTMFTRNGVKFVPPKFWVE